MEETIDLKSSRLGNQIRGGYTAVKEQVGAAVQTAKDEATAAARVAQQEAGAMVDAGVSHVRCAAEDTMQRAKNGARQVVDEARSSVQANPEKWLLIAMGAGVLVGACAQLMVRRRPAGASDY